jgi:hypothetical protein
MGASDTVSAVATAVEMVEVIAPANMAAGYSFQAIYKGVIFPVVVVRTRVNGELPALIEPVANNLLFIEQTARWWCTRRTKDGGSIRTRCV